MKSRFAFAPVAALGLALLLSSACTGQGEGQRCQLSAVDETTNTGTSDCQDGLRCYAAKDITLPGGQSSNADICCPVDRTQAVEDICKIANVTPGSDASIPDTGTPDTGTPDTGAADGATDAADGGDGASPDGAADGSSDAADDGG